MSKTELVVVAEPWQFAAALAKHAKESKEEKAKAGPVAFGDDGKRLR